MNLRIQSLNFKRLFVSLVRRVMFSLGFVILILKVLKQANCSEAAMFQKHKGKHLANYVISTNERTKSEVECGIYCLGHGMCASVNYKTSGKDKGLCELNTETLDAKNGEGTPNAEFNHLYIINRVRSASLF